MVIYKKIAALLAEKLDKPYSRVMNLIRCRLSFSLIRSLVRSLHGCRSSYHTITSDSMNIDLALSEGCYFI